MVNNNFQTGKNKVYDLEERCFQFADKTNGYIRKLPRDIPNIENGKQLARSVGSIAANYIEANESLSKKDFIMRAKISKKEAKETRLWLRLIKPSPDQEAEKEYLIQEVNEIMRILGAILEKSK